MMRYSSDIYSSDCPDRDVMARQRVTRSCQWIGVIIAVSIGLFGGTKTARAAHTDPYNCIFRTGIQEATSGASGRNQYAAGYFKNRCDGTVTAEFDILLYFCNVGELNLNATNPHCNDNLTYRRQQTVVFGPGEVKKIKHDYLLEPHCRNSESSCLLEYQWDINVVLGNCLSGGRDVNSPDSTSVCWRQAVEQRPAGYLPHREGDNGGTYGGFFFQLVNNPPASKPADTSHDNSTDTNARDKDEDLETNPSDTNAGDKDEDLETNPSDTNAGDKDDNITVTATFEYNPAAEKDKCEELITHLNFIGTSKAKCSKIGSSIPADKLPSGAMTCGEAPIDTTPDRDGNRCEKIDGVWVPRYDIDQCGRMSTCGKCISYFDDTGAEIDNATLEHQLKPECCADQAPLACSTFSHPLTAEFSGRTLYFVTGGGNRYPLPLVESDDATDIIDIRSIISGRYPNTKEQSIYYPNELNDIQGYGVTVVNDISEAHQMPYCSGTAKCNADTLTFDMSSCVAVTRIHRSADSVYSLALEPQCVDKTDELPDQCDPDALETDAYGKKVTARNGHRCNAGLCGVAKCVPGSILDNTPEWIWDTSGCYSKNEKGRCNATPPTNRNECAVLGETTTCPDVSSCGVMTCVSADENGSNTPNLIWNTDRCRPLGDAICSDCSEASATAMNNGNPVNFITQPKISDADLSHIGSVACTAFDAYSVDLDSNHAKCQQAMCRITGDKTTGHVGAWNFENCNMKPACTPENPNGNPITHSQLCSVTCDDESGELKCTSKTGTKSHTDQDGIQLYTETVEGIQNPITFKCKLSMTDIVPPATTPVTQQISDPSGIDPQFIASNKKSAQLSGDGFNADETGCGNSLATPPLALLMLCLVSGLRRRQSRV